MGGGRRQWRQEAGSQMLWEKIVRKISAEANELRFTQYNMEEYSIPGIKLWVIWMARFWIASRLSDCALVNAKCHTGTQYSNTGLMTVMYIVFQKKNIHSYYWYKLRNSCLILIIFDDWHQNSSHNLTSHDSLVVHLTKLTCLHYLVKLINRILSPYITYFSIQVVDFRHQIFTNCWNNTFQQSTTVSVVFTDIHYIFFASDDVSVTVFGIFHLPAQWSASSQSSRDGWVPERSLAWFHPTEFVATQ